MKAMTYEWVIETKELTKSYGPHVALDSLSINVPKGATGLLGPNGAGKSTFFKTILGLIQATSGEGKVLGHDIRTEGLDIRSKIGYMPEYEALDNDMDAIHQVRYSGELLGMNPVVAFLVSCKRHPSRFQISMSVLSLRTLFLVSFVSILPSGQWHRSRAVCLSRMRLSVCSDPTNSILIACILLMQ